MGGDDEEAREKIGRDAVCGDEAWILRSERRCCATNGGQAAV